MQDFNPENIKLVSIEEVRPNDYNPKLKETAEYKKVVESIQVNGLKQPILVRETDDGYVIVDGEQRYTACKELGYDQIYIYNLGNISEEKAKSLTVWFEIQTPFDEVALAPLVVELNNLDIPMPYSEEEITDFTNLADFDFVGDGKEKLTIKMTPEQYDKVWDMLKSFSDEMGVEMGEGLVVLVKEGVKRYE